MRVHVHNVIHVFMFPSQIGDQIVAVNGKNIMKLRYSEVDNYLDFAYVSWSRLFVCLFAFAVF